ncbi:hypothetical protein BDU57DRAFT_18030 [Ampelomyces quisqualis]|uniref:CPAF-like PDZ domain-containing protein n=1 Tax=Ampelomyces quisqualis TaxID=50730 RepID=A0A6A5R190_AMPQU|nr:hypothetical protein BDU57DRAFT_18030 [Ampelomyces quisqualis]
MHSSIVLLSAYCGLSAAAGPFPWMYGVPDYPNLDMKDVMTEADVDVLLAAAGDTNTAAAAVQSNNSATPSATSGQEPCAVISSALAAMPPGARPIVPAELGMRCLQSVPLDKEGNMKLIDEMMLYVKWQSNVAYLKDPPAGYTEKPVDVMGELDGMKAQLSAGNFANEYDFQMKMMGIFDRAYDNHFVWQPDLLASAIQFQRPPGTELISVSSDGAAVPEIYAYRDVIKANNDTSFKPSQVMMIDGTAARDYLANASNQGDFHDADTRWNAMFPSQALIASGTTFLGAFRTGMYTGQPNTTLQFANGTTFTMPNIAVAFGNFTNVNSGQTFFQRFCSGPAPPATEAAAPPSTPAGNVTRAKPAPSHVGYPKAEMISKDLAVGGYYINGSGYENVAVLSIPTYDAPDVQAFQNTMRDFIRKSKADGKTKMIFDMRGNGGGNAILGYDTFKQVYPQAEKDPFGGTRFRANDALNMAGNITQDFLARKTFAQSNSTAFADAFGPGTTEDDIFAFTAVFNYQHTLDANNTQFASWQELVGPEQVHNDSFTKTLRYNYSDSVSTSYTGFSVIGFGENSNETATPQPFKAEDMVMLHDGMCSSTCAIASELLKNQGAVRTIAVGGRPQPGPMQGVGGTKGAQVFSWDDIQVRMQAAFLLGSPAQRAAWNDTDLGRTAFASQIFRRSAYQGGRIAGGVNLKDNLRQGDESKTPLEFMYEAADCRMFFTAPMVSDVTQVWKGVADRMFRTENGTGMSMCVEGSTMDKSSVSGGGQFRGGDGQMIAAQAGRASDQAGGANDPAAGQGIKGGAVGRASGLGSFTVVVAVLLSSLLM